MTNPLRDAFVSIDDYFALEERSAVRHEYVIPTPWLRADTRRAINEPKTRLRPSSKWCRQAPSARCEVKRWSCTEGFRVFARTWLSSRTAGRSSVIGVTSAAHGGPRPLSTAESF